MNSLIYDQLFLEFWMIGNKNNTAKNKNESDIYQFK